MDSSPAIFITLKADVRGRLGRLSQLDPKRKYTTDRYRREDLMPIRIRSRDTSFHRRNSLKRQLGQNEPSRTRIWRDDVRVRPAGSAPQTDAGGLPTEDSNSALALTS